MVSSKVSIWAILAVSSCVTVLCFLLPPLHDYRAYIEVWEKFLSTGHPYVINGTFSGDAYGPLFVILAYLFKINTFLPKLLFILAWIGTGLLIIKQTKRTAKISPEWWIFFANPFFYILLLFYGINESITTLSVVLSLSFLLKKNETASGVVLALGVLFKFTPIFLLLFLFLGKNSLRWNFLISFVVTAVIGFGLSYLAWGNEVLAPFQFALNRDPTFLSIFYPFREHIWLIRFSTPILLLSLMGLFIAHWRYRFNDLSIAIVVFLTTFSLYKVVNPQYHMNIVALVALWLAVSGSKGRKIELSRFASYLYIIWMAFTVVLYAFLNQFHGQWEWMRSYISFPTFTTSLLLIITIMKNNFDRQ